MGSSKSRISFTEASLSMAKEWSLGNLDMRESEPQLSLQKSTESPEAIEHDASLLNLAQSLTMSFH
jgi:hypothetical protein